VDMRIEDVSGGVEQTIRALSPGGVAYARTARLGEQRLLAAAQAVLDLSQYYVPVDTEELKNSATLDHEGEGFDVVFTIGYHTDYAVFVHEITEYYHRPPTGAKYLSRAAVEVANGGGNIPFTGDFGVI
jgi:hypothetical protein